MDLDPYASMQVGMRVVRGMDWKWSNQDNGEGNVGTVVEIGRQGSPTTPDKTVVVQWDHGTRTNYRTGFQGAYDLLLYDNAQIGVRHPNIICDCCKKHGIRGMRWKCKICFDYDLCMQCYMNNKHDLSHAFERYETAHSRPKSRRSSNLPSFYDRIVVADRSHIEWLESTKFKQKSPRAERAFLFSFTETWFVAEDNWGNRNPAVAVGVNPKRKRIRLCSL